MTRTSQFTTWGLLATLAATTAAPVLADSQQKNKNNWRNLGVAGAVIAGYGLLTGNKAATVLGAAGAAYSADRYEQDRHNQSQDSNNDRRYYRTYGWHPPVVSGDRYNSDNGQYNNSYDQRDNHQSYQSNSSGWSETQTRHDQNWDKNYGGHDGSHDGDRGSGH